ncbi:MAG: hypothetical protein AB7F96_15395 [Beijerinckiaceae bacterium]
MIDPHPFAEMFPPMTAEENKLLVDDILKHGVREPILIFEGKVLDGLNRQHAANTCRIDCPSVEFDGTREEALALVMSRNMHRRHMSPAARAAVSARWLEKMKADPSLASLLEEMRETALKIIKRPHKEPHEIWPPKEGFRPQDPDTLRAFAHSHGIENTALDQKWDFDNEAALSDARELLESMPEFADAMPKDGPTPNAAEVFGTVPETSDLKNSGGRPPNADAALVAVHGSMSLKSAARTVAVHNSAVPEVIDAMARDELSIKSAAKIAELPRDEQPEALSQALKRAPASSAKRIDPKAGYAARALQALAFLPAAPERSFWVGEDRAVVADLRGRLETILKTL